MQFQESVKTCFNRFSDFKGRSSRSEFWWFFSFFVGVNFVSNAILPQSVRIIVALAMLLPLISVLIRRLHDIGKPGIWAIMWFIPIAHLVVLYFALQKSMPSANAYGDLPADADITQNTH